MLVVAAVFTVFIGRLAQLQLVEGPDHREASQRNFTRKVVLPAERGAVFDRHGRALAVNEPSFDLYVTPARVKNVGAVLDGLTEVLELDTLDRERLRERIEEPRGMWRYQAVLVRGDIDRKRVALAEALRARVDGLSIGVRHSRSYPEGLVGAHLLGYLGKPTAEELNRGSEAGRVLQADSLLGRAGVERRFDDVLAGEDGWELVEVDARGARQADRDAVATLPGQTREDPRRGNDVVLTVDAEVQRILLNALAGYQSGAAVVVDPRDGAVLGMVSKPGYDPNLWSGKLTPEAKRETDENPYNPLLDKSVQSYFPGSVYKVVTALGALEEGTIKAETKISSPGAYVFGNRTFHCHKLSGHGEVDLSGALAASADVYFYKLGETMGIDTLATYGRLFGFGERTALGLNGEAAGVVPTRAWHDEKTPGGYQFGLALSTAIGQGDVRSTPVQVAMAYAAVANGGTLFAPHVVERIQTGDGEVVRRFAPQVVRQLPVDAQHLADIRRGLERVVNDPKIGTGTKAALSWGRIAGKTGTAEVKGGSGGKAVSAEIRAFRERTHAWFAGYAPAESPRLVVVVFLEHGGSGGKDAAPVARHIIEAFHERVEPIFSVQASNAGARRTDRGLP